MASSITINPNEVRTVQGHAQLAAALTEVGQLLELPHFKFKAGKKFQMEQINEALAYTASNDGKAVYRLATHKTNFFQMRLLSKLV